jgi:hypothetical protein
MPNHEPSDQHRAAVEALRSLAREPFEVPAELVQLRHRITSERARVHQELLARIAQDAHIDLEAIFDEARRRNAAKRRYIAQTLAPLEARAAERAKAQKDQFHRVRAAYLQDFTHQLAPGQSNLKFRQPIAWSSEVQSGRCPLLVASPFEFDFGVYDAAADIVPADVGVWLYPYIKSDSRDCTDSDLARTLQDLTYHMGPPAESFWVSCIRVDLIGNGVASATLGDFKWPTKADPLYQHSFVQMDVSIGQYVNGEWHQWPLTTDQLFLGNGDYVRPIRSVLSGETYPAALVIRKPEAGGGDVYCHVQVVCSALAIGSDGRVAIDYRAPDLGIFVGGVSLMGMSV